MTESERQNFLADLHVGIIAIADGERGPLAVPIWYSYENGGDVTVLMHPDSRKGQLIAQAGRFSICAQQEALPYEYVMAEGPVVASRPGTSDDTLAMATRYLGDEMGAAYTEANSGESYVYTMRPERWYSTSYA